MNSSPFDSISNVVPIFLNTLNPKQKEAVLACDGPLIVIAGAGSGKTKMLTARISYLVETRRAAPHQVLAVTFTNKAAGEMRERVEKMLGTPMANPRMMSGFQLGVPEIGTFHSVCIRLIRREADRTPFTKPFVIYDDSDQLSLVKAAMEKLNIDQQSFNPKQIQSRINAAKCDAVEPEKMEISSHDIFGRQVKRIYEQYQKDLFANQALDFGEIICMAYRILRDHADVREKYQKRFKYIHVDEYQDTNRAQYLLLMMLANSKHGGHGNICVVGDEDQSIYKWRGADIRNILNFELEFPGAHTVKLEQNYRSTKTIISAAGKVIKNNTTRKDKTLWTDNEEGTPIVCMKVTDERAEADHVISEIKRLAQYEGRQYSDFSIFYRTNAQSRQFEDALRREKVPYQIFGGLRFYDRKEIKDIISYLKAIMNPSDSISLKRIINVPARGIGKTTLDKIEQHYRMIESEVGPRGEMKSYGDALVDLAADASHTTAATSRKLGNFVSLLQRLTAESSKLLLSELYHLILDETGYVRDLRKEGTEEALARVENLEELDTLFLEFEEDFFAALPPELSEADRNTKKVDLLPLFIEQSALMSEGEANSAEVSSVKMMTLHSSKGLEFPVVFMVGLEEGLFPSIKPWEEAGEEEVEEERRLCYVGMTRARETLYMIYAATRRMWGNFSHNEPSRFFAEIPKEYLDVRDLSGYANQQRSGYSHASAAASTPIKKSDLVGHKINHPDYGLGTILAVEGTGDDQKVTIEFKGKQQRKFLRRYLAVYLEGSE